MARPTMGRVVIVRQGADELIHKLEREVILNDKPQLTSSEKREHPAIVQHAWPEGGDTPAIDAIMFIGGRMEHCHLVEHVSKADPKHRAWDWPKRDE